MRGREAENQEAKQAASVDSSWRHFRSVGGSNSGPICAFGHCSSIVLILENFLILVYEIDQCQYNIV